MGLARTTLIHFLTQIVRSVVGFLGTLYFARVLGAEVLGVYFVVVALIYWINIPINGIGTALTKRISEGEEQGSFFTAGILLILALVLLILASIYLFRDGVNSYVGEDLILWLVVLIVGNAAVTLSLGTIRGRKKVAESGAAQAFEEGSKVIFQLALVLLGYEILALVVGNAVAFFATVLFASIWLDITPDIPEKRHILSLFSYAKYAWLGAMKSRSVGWTDVIVLNFFVASSLIGVYEIAWSLASVLLLISNSVQQTLFPEVSELSEEGRNSRIGQLMEESLIFAGVFLIPGFFGVLVLGEDVLGIYGDEFRKGNIILMILIISRLLSAYEANFKNIVNAVNRPDLGFKINFVSIVTNIPLNVVLIYLFGWYGAAVATTISAGITMLVSYYFAHNVLDSIKVPYMEITKQVFSGSVMALLLLGTASVVGPAQGGEIVTVGMVFFGAFLYMSVLSCISLRMRENIRSVVDSLL